MKRRDVFAKWVKKTNPSLDQAGIREAFNAGWDAAMSEQEDRAHRRVSASFREANFYR